MFQRIKFHSEISFGILQTGRAFGSRPCPLVFHGPPCLRKKRWPGLSVLCVIGFRKPFGSMKMTFSFHRSTPTFFCLLLITSFSFYIALGLHINSKSVCNPTQDLVWLGKRISGKSIVNTSRRPAHALLLLWSMRTHRFTLPILLPRKFFVLLSQAVHFLHLYACHSFTVMPRRAQRVFFGCKLQARSFATSAPAPRWVTTQQDAEMYGVFHVLRQTVLRKFLHVCEATDNAGVFYSVSRGRCSGQKRTRVRLLRKINRLCFLHNVQLQIARSEDNPADKYSRTLSHPEVFFAPAHRSRDRFAFTMSTCSLGRFLWLSPFPVMDLFNFVTAFLCWFAVADL